MSKLCASDRSWLDTTRSERTDERLCEHAAATGDQDIVVDVVGHWTRGTSARR
jgi:hypothetical protein